MDLEHVKSKQDKMSENNYNQINYSLFLWCGIELVIFENGEAVNYRMDYGARSSRAYKYIDNTEIKEKISVKEFRKLLRQCEAV